MITFSSDNYYYRKLAVTRFCLREFSLARGARAARLDVDGPDGYEGDEWGEEAVAGAHDPVPVDHRSSTRNDCMHNILHTITTFLLVIFFRFFSSFPLYWPRIFFSYHFCPMMSTKK